MEKREGKVVAVVVALTEALEGMLGTRRRLCLSRRDDLLCMRVHVRVHVQVYCMVYCRCPALQTVHCVAPSYPIENPLADLSEDSMVLRLAGAELVCEQTESKTGGKARCRRRGTSLSSPSSS